MGEVNSTLWEKGEETNQKNPIPPSYVEVCDGTNQKRPISPSCGIGVTYRKKLQENVPECDE